MNLATKTATWVGNKTEISGSVSTDIGGGVLYVAADGPHYWVNGETRDLKSEIDDNAYRLNTTFPAIHKYAGHGVLYKGRVVYKGQTGMFAYDLRTHEVKPLLLEPRGGTRIVYIDPLVTDDTGTLYVTGLESESGAVGADGPIYALQLD
jgi:sugar lactone lactonase YvrE